VALVLELVAGQVVAVAPGPARSRWVVVVVIGGVIAARLQVPRVEGLQVVAMAVAWLAPGPLAVMRVGVGALESVLSTARIQQQAAAPRCAAAAGARGCGAT
jgi:hypothetical protein